MRNNHILSIKREHAWFRRRVFVILLVSCGMLPTAERRRELEALAALEEPEVIPLNTPEQRRTHFMKQTFTNGLLIQVITGFL